MAKSIAKNYIYNTAYQILALIAPFITTPYLARVLGPENIGIYSYTYSVANYFILLASFGVASYAQREIAYYQDNKHQQSRIFFEISILRLILVLISLFLYYLVVSYYATDTTIYWIQALNILAVLFDISWFFQGLEEFGKIVFRNVIVKVLNIASIFLLIKSSDDLLLYIFLLGSLNVLSGILIWGYLPSYLEKVSKSEINPFRNFIVIVQMFLPVIAIQVYTILDKTMIGVMTQSPLENGYYEQAEKIVRIALTFVTSLGTVMLPRIAYAYAHQQYNEIKDYMMKSYQFTWFISIPMMLGMISIADFFVPWFFGPGYDKVIPLLKIFSVLFIAVGLAFVTGVQYLIPTNRQNQYTISVTCGAVLNFFINLAVIPSLMSVGAAIASIIAEVTGMLIQFYFVRQEFSLWKIFYCSKIYWISGLIMYICIILLKSQLTINIFNTFLLIGIGSTIYIAILYYRKDEMVTLFLKKIKGKVIDRW